MKPKRFENPFPEKELETPFSSEFRKPKNSENRNREFLREDEIERLLEAAKKSKRQPLRNYCIILTSFRHGLRVSEASNLRWRDVDLNNARMIVTRLKNGNTGTHYIYGSELKTLNKLYKVRKSPYVFESDRGIKITDSGIRQLIAKLGEDASFDFPIHPHMLRHSCGYYLANKGLDTRLIQEWLGQVNIANTVIYTRLSPNRFKSMQGIFDEKV